MLDQFGYIFKALSKRRDMESYNIYSIVKIIAEITPLDQFMKISIRCANQADISVHDFCPTDPFNLFFLYCSKNFGLERKRELIDFVKIKAAPVS